MRSKSLFLRFLGWKSQHIKHRYFVFFLSVMVGLLSGLAAVILKNSVHLIEALLTLGFAKEYENYLYIIYPLLGILLTTFVIKRFLFNRHPGHGIPNVLYAISKRSSIIRRSGLINSLLTSAITVGFGGSAGLEGPTIGTSAAIGSNLGRKFRVNYKTKTLLIGCAAASALASIFKAPIAAIVFAIEVIMLDLTMASLIPLLLASVSAAITSRLFLGEDVLFHFVLKDPFLIEDVPFYILLGAVAGVVSLYFSKVYFYVSGFFDKISRPYRKALAGGILLGIMIFFLPTLYGEGYEAVNRLIAGNYKSILDNSPFYSFRENMFIVLIILAVTVLLKAVATTVTFSSGGVGGIFAPTLFMGSMMGFVFSRLLNHYNITSLSESNFTLVGMAGLMAGILHAPLTAIFLIAEITGGYDLFIPLMITAAIGYITSKSMSYHSVYTMQLAKKGELITHHKDKAVLTLMKLKDEIETNFVCLHPEETLGDVVKAVARSNRNLFPVVNERNKLVGIVLLDDIREIMFNQEMYEETYVQDLMINFPAHVSTEENMDTVMQKFEETGAWNLPVIDHGKYVGFVSKSKLFSAYRKLLREFYDEDEG